MPTPYKIAIIGAGPAGATLGRILKHQGSVSEITVFEGEASVHERLQGGSLDLHPNTGIKSLEEAGLQEEWDKHARYDGEALRLADKHNFAYVKTSGSKKGERGIGRPEIDRSVLREILANSLPEGMIKWGHHLKAVDTNGTLHFQNGDYQGFDLVVGADGAWSKVRKVLTDKTPFFAGVTGIQLRITDAEKKAPWVHRIVNRGSWFGFGDNRALSSQQLGTGMIAVSAWFVRPEEWIKSFDLTDARAVKERLHQEFHDWAAEYHSLIEACDDEGIQARPLYMLEPGEYWTTKPGFTLIGDAAHLMTPFAGEGVNLAMTDSRTLAHAIIDAEKVGTVEELHKQVANYERQMASYALPIQVRTVENMKDMYFNPAAPYAVVDQWVVRNVTAGSGFAVKAAVKAAATIYFSWVRYCAPRPEVLDNVRTTG